MKSQGEEDELKHKNAFGKCTPIWGAPFTHYEYDKISESFWAKNSSVFSP
jgi:hypothetical protein